MQTCIGANINGCSRLVFKLHKFVSFPISLKRQLQETCGPYSMMLSVKSGKVSFIC